MDHADLSQLPRPLREALLRVFESLLDLHDVLTQVYPAQPTVLYPRSATELLVLDVLADMAPMQASPKQVADMIHRPHPQVQNMLFALEILGTIYRPTKGYYSTMAPPPLPTDVGRPSTRYAARIARIVAQEASGASQRAAASHRHTPTHEKGTAHD